VAEDKPNYTDLLTEARANLELCQNAEAEWREESAKCNKFLALEQWDESVLTMRGNTRPSLVIDQLGQYRDQLVGDWRRNRLGIKVSPGDGPADEDTAKIIDGLVRQIEYQSKAQVAYDHAFEQMVGSNRGYFRLTTARRKGSFKQDILIKRIPNADCVYLDPFAKEIDYSDMRFAIVVDEMSIEQFKREYGEKTSIQDFDVCLKNYPSWFPRAGSIILAEYWTVEEQARKIQKLNKPIAVLRDNRPITTDIVYDNEWDPKDPQFESVQLLTYPNGEPMEDDEPKRQICQYILNGAEVLDKTEWIGNYIPIIPMMGKEVYVENKRKLFSLISRSLDAQRLFNYAQSSMAERLGQAVRSPVVGAVGQFKTQRQAWQDANTKPVAFLEYDVLDVNGTLAPPPGRADFDPRIDQMVSGSLITKENIKGTLGMYGSSLGQEDAKVKSGVAVKALQSEGDNATFDFLDNGARALELAGCQIVDLIPKIYNEADIIQIRDAQEQNRAIAINQPIAKMQPPPKDQQRDYWLNNYEAKYHVAVSAAPSHATKRAEESEFSMQFFQALPPPDQMKVAPVMLRHQDSTVAKEMADVLDPPQDGPPIPQQVQQQIQMMTKTIDTLTKEVNALNDEREAKLPDLDLRWREACLKSYTTIQVAKITASKDLDRQQADSEAEFLQQQFDHAHEVGMQAMQQAHALEQGQAQHEQGMESQQQAAALQPQPEQAQDNAQA